MQAVILDLPESGAVTSELRPVIDIETVPDPSMPL